jgi:hypothetical protein
MLITPVVACVSAIAHQNRPIDSYPVGHVVQLSDSNSATFRIIMATLELRAWTQSDCQVRVNKMIR